MAKRRKGQSDDVTFIVTYEDGRTERITIDLFTLRNGDGIARQIALEWQAGGNLPPGKIDKVRRALPHEL